MISEVKESCVLNRSTAQIAMTEKGYCVFENVLTDEEIKTLRRTAAAYFKSGGRTLEDGAKKTNNATNQAPEINWVFYHPAILDCFRRAFGTDEIMFTGSTAMQKNALTGWHKDDGTDPSIPNHTGYFSEFNYGCDECRVYRMGIYLQDHTSDGHGLRVLEGSHRTRSVNDGEMRYAGARAGSIVIFDCRLTHAGQLKSKVQRRLFNSRILRPLARQAGKLRASYRAALDRDRYTIYAAFGLPNRYTVEFAGNILAKELWPSSIAHGKLPLALRRGFQQSGVALAEDHLPEMMQA